MKLLLVHPGAAFSTADVWHGLARAFERAGVELAHYALDGRLEVANSWLDMAWRRSGKAADKKPSPADVVYLASTGIIERALRHQVDWVLSISNMFVHPDVLVLLRRARIRTAIIFTESPYNDDRQIAQAPLVDCCWVNERASVPKFRAVQPRTYYWQHAIDQEVHRVGLDEPGQDVPAHDVVFVGTGWPERVELLSAIDWTGIDLGLYGNWSNIGSRSRLRKYLRQGPVENAWAAALYRRAKIGLNLHRTAVNYNRGTPHITEPAESMNPRGYELGACGLFHISDYRAEVAEVYGELVPTFETAEELQELIRYYLAHEEERREIAAQLPARLRGHNFDARARDLLAVLRGLQ